MAQGPILLSVLVLLVASSAPQPPNIVAIMPGAGPVETGAPVPWRACSDHRGGPAYDGNRWWGEFEACSGDLRVRLRADSVDLSGPGLGIEAETRRCFRGEPAAVGGNVDPDFFRQSSGKQLAKIKASIRKTVGQIGPECGGPFDPAPLFDTGFDARFAEFADRYWRGLEPDRLAEALDAQRREAGRATDGPLQ